MSEMCHYIYISILLITFSNQCHAQGQNENINEDVLREKYGPVIFANLLYRHGDRNILYSYPNDPNKNSSLWKTGLGQLTKKGQVRHFHLGKWIRTQYPDLVGDSYSVNNIYVVSSDEDRCLMSAQSNLAGMYSGHNYSDPPFQAIPVHTMPIDKDNMIYMGAPCPKYNEEEQKLKSSKFVKEFDQSHTALYRNLTLLTGAPVQNLSALGTLYDTLKIEDEDMGLKLPSWTESYYPQPLKDFSTIEFLLNTYTGTMKRLKAGPLLTDMVNHLTMKAEGTLKPDRKLWVYSGHDVTIVALLHALNLHKHNITGPSYATLVALELRRKEKEHFVTILYRDGVDENITQIRMNGCDDACSLETFVNLTNSMMIRNWEEECRVRSPSKLYITNDISLGTTEILYVFFILLFSAIIYLYCCQPRTVARYYKLHNEEE